MRSKATNILQIGILIAGIVYMVVGIVYGCSPIFFANIFGIDVNPDWFNLTKSDTFIAPLYHCGRAFAMMLAVIGLSMILPLFDPLKYRPFVYFSGVVSPIMMAIIMLYHGVVDDHLVLTICGSIFLLLAVYISFGLMITREKAKLGQE